MAPFLSCILELLLIPVLFRPVFAEKYRLPNSVYNGSVDVEFTSSTCSGSLDGPKISPQINDTTYDWWYFDAVSSTSTNESVVIVFYESSGNGFLSGSAESPLSVSFTGTFANGTAFSVGVPLRSNDSAVVVTRGDGASGVWGSSGFSFEGAHDLSEYTVSVDNAAYGISGTLKLTSIAPAHYPGVLNEDGASEFILPHVGWSNAIPGAIAEASFTIGGEDLCFQGVGYHDKNWGDSPFVEAVSSWYWGHATIGPYTLVWFDALSTAGAEHISAYVSRNGTVLAASNAVGSLSVRPFGANDRYPPTVTTGTPAGFAIVAELDDGTRFVANTTTGLATITGYVWYDRLIGDLMGGIEGGELYEGRGQWEQFKFSS